jgi:hypothetical protein
VPTAAMMMPIREPVLRPESELPEEELEEVPEVGVEPDDGAGVTPAMLSVVGAVRKSKHGKPTC